MSKYEVIVIGGGPSGLMASIAAAEQGASVALVDKGDKLGRKLGISGGGRCNVTNIKEIDELIQYIPGGGRFLYSAFSLFSNRDIIAFFESLGIALKEEDNGRMFPVSDKAKTVVDALVGKARSLGVKLLTHHPVQEVMFAEEGVQGIKLTTGEPIEAKCVIIATGGKSVPHTGSTGDGYPWATAAGHTITELYPTEVPIVSKEPFITDRSVQGLSLRNVKLSVLNAKGKAVVAHQGDMIFTHFGLSGPIALRCSGFIRSVKQKSGSNEVKLALDLFPEMSQAGLDAYLRGLLTDEPKKTLKNVLKGTIPERLLPLLFERAALSGETTYEHLPKEPWFAFTAILKSFMILVTGTRPFEEAFVTGGGIHLKEVSPQTMESKLMPGLFFCGEVLDIHGYTGGYNITAAFATGYTAGHHAGLLAQGH
ncbi:MULTISPECIES: NAD(P)/FAD-dependent oxidoreductase [unclassified Paenibacillus]|uniref:NAD(P)/FAD-dependent oxidoreductase n=1 Tax=unclassified Paenibacillus TaxID=185978 RepID=UPI00083965CF|nr:MULTISPECIES: NAD(P)/FAD-dependent oxidoreductase [unclassified Paenibacillus]NWL89681.1 NAD(P)/FAD-dependent oxidoreductase [Paenibacillus sp. 79R4]